MVDAKIKKNERIGERAKALAWVRENRTRFTPFFFFVVTAASFFFSDC